MTDQAQKTILVVGGSSGIGFATAQALTRLGHAVILAGRDRARLDQARMSIEEADGVVDVAAFDAFDRGQVAAAVETTIARYGKIDGLVNAAGFNVPQRQWHDLKPDEFESVIDGNLVTAFNTIHAVLPHMRGRRYGVIVNVASMAGKAVTIGAGVAYTIAK